MPTPEPAESTAAAIASLTGTRWRVSDAGLHVSPTPGLYAIYGDDQAWIDLGLTPTPDQALYVGKSEDNLVRRELDTHFAANPMLKPRTGSSTVRRSFAALLRTQLDLHAVPRNPENPERFSNFGLPTADDARLTAWMHERLTLAVWERPATLVTPLTAVEVSIIRLWTPPLNIKDNPRPLARLRQARQAMAKEASIAATSGTYEAPAVETTPVERQPIHAAASGLTPSELARELGKSPKTVRQALRDRYGKLPFIGDRWGALTAEQEQYIRSRFR